jgi:regulator of ribonuclease activity A
VADLASIGFGIKALGTNPAKSSKTGARASDEPVTSGGVEFKPAEWIFCDVTGILAASHEL